MNEKLRILIICTWFPPDSSIAAKRPYYFAKYLSEFGHNVTIIHSGKVSNIKDDFYKELKNVKIITYSNIKISSNNLNSKLKKLPSWIKTIIKFPIFIIKSITNYSYRKEVSDSKKIIGCINKIDKNSFDIVFTTFGNLSNAFAGEYAKDYFNCKWIMDFRDPVFLNNTSLNFYDNRKCINIEKSIIKKADCVTCVSKGLLDRFNSYNNNSKIYLLYNGFDVDEKFDNNVIGCNKNLLSFVYTGTIYKEYLGVIEDLAYIIKALIDKLRINCSDVNFHYAGNNGTDIQTVFNKYGLNSCFVNHGYLSRKDVYKLQSECDIFIGFSYNILNTRGVITGKIFEGMAQGKPILYLVGGDEINSELFEINKTNNFGYVYEKARGTCELSNVINYLIELYNIKHSSGNLNINLNHSYFNYINLTKQLENICYKIL